MFKKDSAAVTIRGVNKVSTDSRRRVGTIFAVAFAMLLAYHIVAGANGINVYKQKMAEDKLLSSEVQQLQQENDLLRKHVDHLSSDPDAIEFEAHRRLRYTRSDQVIVLNEDQPSAHR